MMSDVVAAVERQAEPLLAVGRMISDVADLAERLDEVFSGIAVVFDDQQTHCVHRNAPVDADQSEPFTVAKIYLAILHLARCPKVPPKFAKGRRV